MFKLIFILFLIALLLIVGILIGVYILQERLAFSPEKLPQDFKYTFEGNWEEVYFTTEPGIVLNALHFKAEASKGLVLYFHGNAGSLKKWGSVGQNFTPLGYDVLVMDYRGYGKSTGKIKKEADLHYDAAFIYKKMAEQYPKDKIVILGYSMGSGVASELAVNHSPSKLLLIAPFYNLTEAAKYAYPTLPSWLLRYKFANDENLQKVKCPVYLFHGTGDTRVPYDHSVRLEQLADSIKLYTIGDSNHRNITQYPAYHAALAEILR